MICLGLKVYFFTKINYEYSPDGGAFFIAKAGIVGQTTKI